MTKRMLIDAAHTGETRVAIIEHDTIVDYDFTSTSKSQLKGNIYLAKITRVEPSLQAAFVEYGGGKQGFLPFSEIHPDYYQLPADDKQKLLAEQIAEAEAEEAAEEEAFEREQAARENRGQRRRVRGESGDEEENEDEFDALEDDGSDPLLAPETPEAPVAPVAVEEPADSISSEALAMVPTIELPQAFAPEDSVAPYQVEPLMAEGYSIAGDQIEDMPEDQEPTDLLNAEEGVEPGAATETTSEDAEETKSRQNRNSSARSIHRRYRIQEVIKRNQIVLVQVIKEERGNKGCSLTSYISLAGRCAVLMPNSPKGGGISRKITDRETRKRLKEVASEMRTHRGMSVIIRTAGIDRTKAEIRRDYEYLVKLWNTVREGTLKATAPALIYEEGNLIKRSLRDQYTSDIAEVIVEGEEAFNDAKDFMRMLMPSHAARIKLYKETMPLFSFAGVEDQLSGMMDPQVKLPSGGYIVIHATEALIAIDVNSGRSTTERNVEETALKTNMEAAAEVARQLRLRDLAGLIVVDFIDMNYGKNRKSVERAMKDALKTDRAKIQMGRISMFGLMELSRQRLRPSLSEAMGIICPHCRGTGYIHSVETIALQIIRTLEKEASSGEFVTLRVTTHPEAALHLLNEKRALLQQIEERYKVNVVILMDAAMINGNARIIKVNHEGKEALHEDSKAPRGGRRGRRGGKNERPERGSSRRGGVNFANAVEASDDEPYIEEARDGDDEIIGSRITEEGGEATERKPRERGERSERSERGERGEGRRRGRRGGRNRDRGPRLDENGNPIPREPREPKLDENGNPIAREPREPREPKLDEHGNPIAREPRKDREPRAPREPKLDENGNPLPQEEREGRRRGRRGGRGRNRNREDRPDRTPRDPAAVAAAVMNDAIGASAPAPRERDAAPAQAPVPRVIPLSEAQTNPQSSASPRSEPTDDANKPKKKGWFSRVLES